MNYYSHNIGDYRRDTGHLSLLEHGIYRQLLDTYYLDEKPIPLDEAKVMRTHSVRSAEEMQALKNVLSDFFVSTPEGYIHKRCDIEIEAFHAKSSSASESAKVRWERVRAEKQANAMRTHSEGNANQEPITSNHKPVTINQEDSKPQKPKTLKADASRGSRLPTDWLLPKSWGEWAIEERKDMTVEDVRKIAASFKDHWISQPSRHGVKADWEATWRNWIRKERRRTVVSFADRKAKEKEESQAALDAWARGESRSTFIEGEFCHA